MIEEPPAKRVCFASTTEDQRPDFVDSAVPENTPKEMNTWISALQAYDAAKGFGQVDFETISAESQGKLLEGFYADAPGQARSSGRTELTATAELCTAFRRKRNGGLGKDPRWSNTPEHCLLIPKKRCILTVYINSVYFFLKKYAKYTPAVEWGFVQKKILRLV